MDKKMKKLLTSFKGGEKGERGFLSRSSSSVAVSDDSPEAVIAKAISDFCQSGGPHNANPGEEVLYLPTIVDAAESSPTAAKEAATLIRKNLDMKNASKPYLQYNSIMLIRILCDHPGRTFTRNLNDAKFGGAVKALIRDGRDPSVWQILSETLDHFEQQRTDDEGLQLLREVWAKEKKHMANAKAKIVAPPPPGQRPTQFPRGNSGSRPPPQLPPRLPPPEELVGRISEAQTSAKLLEQVVQSTPQAEIPMNELVKEFADRCRIASRSVQGYVQADPPPDEDTLTTLIETNDLLTTALNRHQTAVAAALKKQETHRTHDSRMMTVGDPNAPELFTPIDHNTRPTAGVPVVGSVGMHGAGARQDEDEEHSPVSPISPQQSHQKIQYRY